MMTLTRLIELLGDTYLKHGDIEVLSGVTVYAIGHRHVPVTFLNELFPKGLEPDGGGNYIFALKVPQ